MQGRFSIEGNCSTMKTFPDKLDNAIVLEFSEFGNFGTIKGDNRTVMVFCNLPVSKRCKLLFVFCAGYDYDFDVIIDDLGETIEICKK